MFSGTYHAKNYASIIGLGQSGSIGQKYSVLAKNFYHLSLQVTEKIKTL